MSAHLPQHDNERGITLMELMIAVAVMSILAATAIPSFVRFIRKSKTSEAHMNIRKLYDGSVMYFAREFGSPMGDQLEARFPESTSRKPAAYPTSATVVTSDWHTVPTWVALNFTIADPHRFTYQYDSAGTENAATFTASAFADLDMDGIPSTFVRFGTIHEMEVRGSGGIYTENEYE